jgi:phosphate acetyltransferase
MSGEAALDAGSGGAVQDGGSWSNHWWRVDGPLAFDNAVSPEAARTKGIISPVAGQANILVVPDLEAGNMLVKQLDYLADAQSAGIVLGARVPIILTSCADSPLSHTVSCAIAVLLAQGKPKAKP